MQSTFLQLFIFFCNFFFGFEKLTIFKALTVDPSMERCPNDLTQFVNIFWLEIIYYLFIKIWFLLILFEQVFFLFFASK